MIEFTQIIGSLWEYGALVVLLSFAVWKLWSRLTYLENELIKLAKDYGEIVGELNKLIKGNEDEDH